MAASPYEDDATGLGRYGYGGARYTEYGARQAAQGRQYASGALPYAEAQPPYDPFFNASSSTLYRDARDARRSRGRHRSLPPPARRQSRRKRDRSSSTASRDDEPGKEDPIRKAQGMIKDAFSDSTSGLGIGVLGAIVGGLIASEASEAVAKGNGPGSHHRSYHGQGRSKLLSTVLGAAVGGFGANALEKRIEKSRDKIAVKEDAWEKKRHRNSRGPTIRDDLAEKKGRRRSQRRHGEIYAR